MATNFPGSQDSFTNPTSSDTLDSPDHAAQHANVNDAVEAIELALLDGAPLFIDDTNERVGIGTTSPVEELHVDGDMFMPDGGNLWIGNNADSGGRVRLHHSTNGTAYFDYYDSLYFRSGASSSSNTVTFTTSGRVGIGTTAPGAELDIRGASAPEIRLQSTDSTDPSIYFGDQTDAVRGGIAFDISSNTLQFRGYNNTTRMSIDSAGNVNIPINLYVSGIIDVNEVRGDDGGQSDPSFTFTTDGDTGMYRYQSNSIAFSTGGTRRTLIHSDGNIYQYYQLLVPNMSATSSYNTVRWNTGNGHLMRYSSTIDIKKDIVDIKPVMEYLNERSLIHDLRPVLFHEKDQPDGTNNTRGEYLAGMIAQEVLEVAPELCYYDHNGELTSYGLEALIPHLVAEIQRLTPLVEEMYGTANPDWVAPTPRPAERATAEREIYDEAAAAQALVGLIEPPEQEEE
jgi:hypothetical protein